MASNPANPPSAASAQPSVQDWSSPSQPPAAGVAATSTSASSAVTAANGPANSSPNSNPTIPDAIATISKDDFAKVANTPCARQGFLVGIGAGAGVGGLRFVLRGNITKSANWAVGFFLLGSIASYEYCQGQRRAERSRLKRQVEIVTEERRQTFLKQQEEAKRKAAQKLEEEKLEDERRRLSRPWYKFW